MLATARLAWLAWLRLQGNPLLDNLELLHQDISQFLDNMRTVVGALQLHHNCLNNLVVDAAQVNLGSNVVFNIPHFDRCFSGWPGGRWRRGRIGSVPLCSGRIREMDIRIDGMGPFYLSGSRGLSVHAFGRAGWRARGE